MVSRVSRKVWQWLVESPDGEFIAGGYCRSRLHALADLTLWVTSRHL